MDALHLGSAQLLVLLVERAQRRRDGFEEKLRTAESEVLELKRQRTEDAKANDKVVGIFASHEQKWIAERKRLKSNIDTLVEELRAMKARLEQAEKAKEEARSAFADLEAEIARAKQETAVVSKKKDAAVLMTEKLSDEIAKVRKDRDQKDKIVSAMLRKSKVESDGKEEVKVAKAKKRQAESDTDKWRIKKGWIPISETKSNAHTNRTLHDYLGAEWQKERKSLRPKKDSSVAKGREDLEKQTSAIERKHHREVEAFVDQLRIKDQKLAAARWRVVSTEVKVEALRSHIEVLDGNLNQMGADNLKLEVLLLDREDEIRSLKERFENFVHHSQKRNSNFSSDEIDALGVAHKIKSLKQQLVVLEKLVASNESDCSDDNKQEWKVYELVISLLNKQVKRIQTLQENMDDLCRRMNPNSRTSKKMLRNFLEESLQLQRYMVASGQNLTDIESEISCSFGGADGTEELADVIRALFREIQRGTEMRIARIISDIEGTLARN